MKPNTCRSAWTAPSAKSWKDQDLDLNVVYTVEKEGDITEHVSVVRWNAETDQLRLISDQLAQ